MVTPRSYTRGRTRKNGNLQNSKRGLDYQHRIEARFDARADAIIKEYKKIEKQIKTAETKLEALKEKKEHMERVIKNFNAGEARSTATVNQRRFGQRSQRSMATRMKTVARNRKYGVRPRY